MTPHTPRRHPLLDFPVRARAQLARTRSKRRRFMGNSSSNASQPPAGAAAPARGTMPTLGDCMALNARRYLADLNGTPCRDGLYARMLREIEPPLLREVLAWSGGNQSRAAEILGIHRATLRKKLRDLGLD